MQHIDFSISTRKIAPWKLCFAQTYGIGFKMNSWCFCALVLVLCCEIVVGEFAGRRHQLPENGQFDKNDLLEKLSKYIEEQARMRFQQQVHQHHKLVAPQEITGPGFSFMMPPLNKENFIRDSDQPIQFAVEPFDSRYYETKNGEEMTDNFSEALNENREESDPIPEGKNKILIPPPMHVQPMHDGTDKILHRAQLKQARIQAPDVMQKPMQVEYDNTMSLYLVALIAGLSCAFSTGLIALGIMYWTLHKKSKSADTCDYVFDYGVIGPRAKNSENSQIAMGDKKLAHSAQMFHYQHQKNQIIAMENRNAELNHNDEDNDSDDNENDFTVYECPGLAEWDSGMEVKNPLFSEETPASKTDKAQAPTSKAANQK